MMACLELFKWQITNSKNVGTLHKANVIISKILLVINLTDFSLFLC